MVRVAWNAQQGLWTRNLQSAMRDADMAELTEGMYAQLPEPVVAHPRPQERRTFAP